MRQTHLTIYHAKNKQIQSNKPLASFIFPKAQLVLRATEVQLMPGDELKPEDNATLRAKGGSAAPPGDAKVCAAPPPD